MPSNSRSIAQQIAGTGPRQVDPNILRKVEKANQIKGPKEAVHQVGKHVYIEQSDGKRKEVN